MIWEILIFVASLIALLWGAERLVDSASEIAKRLGVSEIVIGLTILSIGTSLPEIATSVASFTSGHADVGLGNIIGSELVQITLILGLVGFIRPLKGKRKEILFYGVSMFVAVLLALFFVSDDVIRWYEGLILCLSYIVFLYFVVKRDKKLVKSEVHRSDKSSRYLWSMVFLGLILTVIGSKFLLSSTVSIAEFFGTPEYIISFFLVGLGTSLPELMISGMAVYKRDYGMSVGNLLGSNITDPTFSFGIGALFVNSSAVYGAAVSSIVYLLIVFVLVIGLFYYRKKIGYKEGLLLLALYVFSFFVV